MHVYSCTLVLNSIPHRWRGEYNEDTDICLQVLADGWCTILVNAYLAKKTHTMKTSGGNTDVLYQGDGRLNEKLKVKNLRLKHLKRLPGPIKAIRSILEIKKLIKQEQPSVLFLCSTMAGVLGSITGKRWQKQGMKVIYRIGGWAFNDPRPRWQKKLILFLEKTTSKYKDKIIVILNLTLNAACATKSPLVVN